MMRTRVIPCLLLKHGRLVKTIKFKQPTYVGDPINIVRIFNTKEVDEIVFLDITATIENKPPDFNLIQEIASECFMPFAYGGGISTIEQIKQLFNLGAEKVVLNSSLLKKHFVQQVAECYGNQSIIASIDVKKNWWNKYRVFTHSGKHNTRQTPVAYVRHLEAIGVGEILLTSIDCDGMMQGYDIELIKQVTEAVQIPVIACGGAGELNDFVKAVKEGGASAVAAGSMVVYQGKNRAVLTRFPKRDALTALLP